MLDCACMANMGNFLVRDGDARVLHELLNANTVSFNFTTLARISVSDVWHEFPTGVYVGDH